MNIPRFTAEYSMGGRKRFDGAAPRRRSGRLNPEMSPAATNTGTRHACFNLCRGNPGCVGECVGALGGDVGIGGNGGPSSPPDMVCGPCRAGRQKCLVPGRGVRWDPC